MKQLEWEHGSSVETYRRRSYEYHIWRAKTPLGGIHIEQRGYGHSNDDSYRVSLWGYRFDDDRFATLKEAMDYCWKELEKIALETAEFVGLETKRPMPPANKGQLFGDTAIAWWKIQDLADVEIRSGDLRRLMGGEIGTDDKYRHILRDLCRKGLLRRTYIGVYRKVLK